MSSPEPPRSLAELVGWTPFQIEPRPDNILVHWIHLDGARFTEPFFGQTIEKCLKDPSRPDPAGHVVTTPITALAEVANRATCLPPGAFVFHCARAGSTLLANVLRALPGNLVLAEPQPFNQLMGAPHRRQEKGPWPAWMRDLLACLSQQRHSDDRRSIVKFNSLATLEGTRLAEVFPGTPCLFLYRHPLEVMASALESPPIWLKLQQDPDGAARRLSLPPEAVSGLSVEDFCGLALRQIFQAALAQENWTLLNYKDLRPETLPAITEALGLSGEGADSEAARAAFRQDAKDLAGSPFTEDAGRKRAAMTPATEAAYTRYLEAPYEALEARQLFNL